MSALTIIEGPCAAEGNAYEESVGCSALAGHIHELLRCNHPYAHRPEADEQNDRTSYVQHGIDHGVPLPTLRARHLDFQEIAGIFKNMATLEVVSSCPRT